MAKKRKIVYQKHHISYDELPDFTLRVRRWQHLWLTRISQLKSTPEHLEEVNNLIISLQFIARRMIKEIKRGIHE